MTPTAKRRLKWLAVVGMAVLCVWGGLRWRAAVALQAQIEATGYYRVRAAYTVKDTGERIAFDYVAACATVVTMYRDGDRSVDTPFGIAPKTIVLPTRDGHAIQVVTPNACHGQVEDGFIPPDLIPLTIWHDDVEDLHFGWGYTSQDAYDNARSRMDFEGATVMGATWADFMAWRAKAEAEFKPVGQIRSPWGYSVQRGVVSKVPTACHFYIRYPVFPVGKPALTAEWERRGRPEFWMVDDNGNDPQAWEDMPRKVQSGNDYPYYAVPRTKGGGLGTIQLYSHQVWGKVHYHRDQTYPDNEVYPYLPISLASDPPPTPASRVFPTRVPVSDDWKGLAACGKHNVKIDDVFRAGLFNAVLAPTGDRYTGEPIGDRTAPFMANDTVLRVVPFSLFTPPKRFFQRDEFVLTNGSNVIEWDCPVLVDSLLACGLRLGQGCFLLGFVGHW